METEEKVNGNGEREVKTIITWYVKPLNEEI